ncbi:MAG: hypothetical protein AAGJ28_17825 [Pseudomonadota bacterium]
MKSVLLGIAAAILLSAAAWYVTGEIRTSSAERFTSPNNTVRLD